MTHEGRDPVGSFGLAAVLLHCLEVLADHRMYHQRGVELPSTMDVLTLCKGDGRKGARASDGGRARLSE
jgi:hypothetical protein